MTTLSVVVPATDDPPTLPRCLAAIEGSLEPPDQVVVVTESELTASAARNTGAARADGDVVVFVDADVEVHPDVFRRIRERFEASEDLTALFGSYDDEPDHPSLVSAFRNLLHHHVHHRNAGPAQTFWTGLGAVRRSTFLALGGFDEARYPHPSIEDIELGDRLLTAGADVRLDPTIQGKHLKRWTLRSMLWTDLVRRAVPWISLQVRTRRLCGSLNCGWTHRLSALATVAVVVAVAATSPVLLAGALAALVVLNRGFYALLAHQLGALRAVGGVALHGLHHLVGVVAVPVGLGVALVEAVAPIVERPAVEGARAE